MDWGFIYIWLLSAIEIYGDFAFRFYAQTNSNGWLFQGIIGYIGVVYFLIQSFRYNNVLYVNNMWDGASSIIESIAAYVLLGDRLKKPTQYVGIIMIMLGMYLVRNGF